MNDLTAIQNNQTLDSREVADMVGKEHSNLMRDIRRYIDQLGEGKIEFTDFFQNSAYMTEQNKTMPCFSVTRKGCEFIAHKLTGTKGAEFTAKYINRFHSMEETIKSGALDISKLSPQLQFCIQIETEQKEQAAEIQKIKEEVQLVKEKLTTEKQVGIAPVQMEISLEADFYNKTMVKDRISTERIATMYCVSVRTFYDTLHKMGIVIPAERRGWVLNPIYENKGVGFNHNTTTEYATVTWSQKGMKLIKDMLKNNGVTPLKKLPQKKKLTRHKGLV